MSATFGDARLPARFWAKVLVAESGCWEWQASKCHGYGYVAWAGKLGRAHRVAYQVLIAAIPSDRQIDHLCRNKACVNPAHMEVVTGRINTMRADGPSARNARKTHCPKGHEYTAENTWTWRNQRYCRTCSAESSRLQWIARKAKRTLA